MSVKTGRALWGKRPNHCGKDESLQELGDGLEAAEGQEVGGGRLLRTAANLSSLHSSH